MIGWLFALFTKVYFGKVRLFFAIALFFPFHVLAQDTQDAGETLFKGYCVACHTIGQGRLVGPDLKGVTEKLDESWLISFIQSSQTMVAKGDSDAVKIFNEYMIPMPDQPLKREQIMDLLSYIKSQSVSQILEANTDQKELSNSENLPLVKSSTILNKGGISFIEVVLISIMGVELITILVLINLVFMLIKSIKLTNK